MNLASSYLSKPSPQLEVNCITTSNIGSLLILPVRVEDARNLKPGVINNITAEALNVCPIHHTMLYKM
jgi:hypothetical protein